MKQETILVVGASGTIGSELVHLLKAKGYQVRGTTSKPVTGSNQDFVQVDLSTGQGIDKAFQGVDRAFLLSPPGYADQYSILSRLIAEAKKNQIKKVVLMTAMGANAVETTPFRRAELELEKSGLVYNIIRPNWFFQNFHTFWGHGIKEQGKILVPGGKAKVSFIDTRDIAAVAAQLLTSEEFSGQAFDLTGPKAYDHDDVAAAISAATGRSVSYQEIAPEMLQKGLLQAGLPADYVEFMLMIFGFLREGYNTRTENSVQRILGKKPRDLSDYANDFRNHWV